MALPCRSKATIWIFRVAPPEGTGLGSGVMRHTMVSVVPSAGKDKGTPEKLTVPRPKLLRSSWDPLAVWSRSKPPTLLFPAHWALANPEQPSNKTTAIKNQIIPFMLRSPRWCQMSTDHIGPRRPCLLQNCQASPISAPGLQSARYLSCPLPDPRGYSAALVLSSRYEVWL